MKNFLLLTILAITMLTNCLYAQDKVIPLYKGAAPGSESWTQKEAENNNNSWNTRVVYNVTEPTLTYFAPDKSKANGTAVVICPGGGFKALSIDSEGYDVARWLNRKGISCFVLKYRLVETLSDDPVKELFSDSQDQKERERKTKEVIKLALQDGLNSVSYVRNNASEYDIDVNKIGIMGFSAGGTVTASVAYNYNNTSKPNFIAPIYLQYEWTIKNEVPNNAPPMFILAASNDQLGLAPHSIDLYQDWVKAGNQAELHMYAEGGHGFGMRTQHLPSDNWIELFYDWLNNIKL
ncbi:alpha/beta hydrolase [Porifericola rhodea]|uniref:alpha/beta hydrolase n=1 Tax=Porifericola rhodea TaxID=930972 RepID=UPI002665228C|nr:alpha/beta hydrolase [Porifericola rhodea]WKN30900.1 alpha/beta hydrolase [Porifericola rhodea]